MQDVIDIDNAEHTVDVKISATKNGLIVVYDSIDHDFTIELHFDLKLPEKKIEEDKLNLQDIVGDL